MKTSRKRHIIILTAIAIVGLLATITTLPGTQNFQAQLKIAENSCEKLTVSTLNQQAVIANQPNTLTLQTTPSNFDGSFTYLTTSGTFDDLHGNKEAIIQTTEKTVNFSGAEKGAIITIQADGENNENCLATLTIQ